MTDSACHIAGEHQFIEGERDPRNSVPSFPYKCEVGNVFYEDMEDHRKDCSLEMMNCTNECGQCMHRRNFTTHTLNQCLRRQVVCDCCGTIGEPQFISDHEKICPKHPVHCRNNCDAGIMYTKDMAAHKKECPLGMVLCEYHNVGCEERMMHKSKKEHEKE